MPCCFGGVEDQLEEDCAADRERKAEREEVSWTGEAARLWCGALEIFPALNAPMSSSRPCSERRGWTARRGRTPPQHREMEETEAAAHRVVEDKAALCSGRRGVEEQLRPLALAAVRERRGEAADGAGGRRREGCCCR